VVTVIVSELAKFLVDVTRRTAKQLARPLAPVDMPAREHEPFRGLRPFWWHQCPVAEVDVLNQLQVLAVTHPEFYPGLKAFRQHARQLGEPVDYVADSGDSTRLCRSLLIKEILPAGLWLPA